LVGVYFWVARGEAGKENGTGGGDGWGGREMTKGVYRSDSVRRKEQPWKRTPIYEGGTIG